jgi:exosortase H (IPTLxxWG-CTERM-specific)
MGLFYASAVFTPAYRGFMASWLPFNARVSGALLSVVEQDVTVSGASISSPRFAVDVKPECSAIEPMAFLTCAILAFPAPLRRKISGILAGAVAVTVLNIVRIVSLYLVGVYDPDRFKMMHLEVWQVLLIVFAVVFWLLWMQWTMKNRKTAVHIPP